MAAERRLCSNCNTLLPATAGNEPVRCPTCGKRLAPRFAVATPLAPGPALGDDLAAYRAALPPRRRSWELPIALALIAAISAWYFLLARTSTARGSSAVEHGMGIVGFLLMLVTESAYSLRKRIHRFTFGSMRAWMQAHVITGLVGACLVVLHAAGKYQGLAGVLAFLTLILIVSGFIGRYIYTAVPRSSDDAEIGLAELRDRIAVATGRLRKLGVEVWSPDDGDRSQGPGRVLLRPWLRWRQRRAVRRLVSELEGDLESHANDLEELLAQRGRLEMQLDALVAGRRLLALWHLFHVPLSVLVFALAFVHIGAAVHYAMLLR
jgi:hypothetical protein